MPDKYLDDFKPFSLTESFLEKYKNMIPPFGFNGLGYLVYMRTYSRIKDDGTNEQWYETIARVVNGTYNMQKRWIIGNRLYWNEQKAQYSAREMFTRMYEMKFLPPGRGLWAMGTPITEEKGLYAALNNCFAYDTEFITNNGIKKLGECVNTEQTILTRSQKWVNAPIKSFGKQKLMKLVLIRQGMEKIIYPTPNHRWFAKSQSDINHNKGYQEYHTKDLKPKYRLPYSFGQGIKGYRPSPQGIAHGIVFGDGTTALNTHLYLCGEKNKELIKWFPLNERTSDENKCDGGAIRVADIPNHYKELPSIKESRNYLLGWLMGYFAADGSNTTLVSYDRKNIEFVRSLCAKLGIGTWAIRETKGEYEYKNDPDKECIAYSIKLMNETLIENFFLLSHHKEWFVNNRTIRKPYWNVKSVEETNREEEVYCVVVEEHGNFTLADNIVTGNCAFVSTEDLRHDQSKPFTFLMDASMLGVGVGFDTKGSGEIIIKGINKDRQVETYQIPDTREGWVESVGELLDAYFCGHSDILFDYSLIRGAGEPIRGFGGTSSGPGPLKELHDNIRNVLEPLTGKEITVRAIVDIMNFIGKAVVAGNVRRTAIIVIGEKDNDEYLNLKNYDINPERSEYGWTSNNSIYAELGMDYEKAANLTWKNGEPGYIWLENIQSYSRIQNGKDNKDHRAKGVNPCAEQSLEPYELCNLVETFPMRHESLEDYLKTLKYAYLYSKTVTLGQTHWPETNRVMLRNRRIGCSVSGVAQFITEHGIEVFRTWLETGYDTIQDYDTLYSEWLAIPRSIKFSSVKPSGTVSLLVGATPGIHFPESRFYIRRIRLAKNSKLIKPLKKAGYNIEDAYGDPSSVVVDFPIDIGEGIRTVNEVSMWEQLSLAAFMQRHWADNQVSCTITFDPDKEGKNIANALNFFQYQLKGISFLPKLNGGAFPQMPYEEISGDEYNKKLKKLKKLDFTNVEQHEAVIDRFCNTDYCELNTEINEIKEGVENETEN